MSVQEACEAANITSYQMRSSFDEHEAKPGRLTLNDEMPSWVRKELTKMGYTLDFGRKTSGPITAIYFDREHGTLWEVPAITARTMGLPGERPVPGGGLIRKCFRPGLGRPVLFFGQLFHHDLAETHRAMVALEKECARRLHIAIELAARGAVALNVVVDFFAVEDDGDLVADDRRLDDCHSFPGLLANSLGAVWL